jgi:hypothetical protein
MYNQVMHSFTQDSPVETCLGYSTKIPLDLLYGKDVWERDATRKFIQRIQQVSQAVKEKMEEYVILDRRLRNSCKNDITYLRVCLKGTQSGKAWRIEKEIVRDKSPHLPFD